MKADLDMGTLSLVVKATCRDSVHEDATFFCADYPLVIDSYGQWPNMAELNDTLEHLQRW